MTRWSEVLRVGALAWLTCGVVFSAAGQASQPAGPAAGAGQGVAKPDAGAVAGKKHDADEKGKVGTGDPVAPATQKSERKAAKDYLAGVQLMEKGKPQAAWPLLKLASEAAPGNGVYARAAELAKQSTVTQLVEEASRQREAGSPGAADELLKQAQGMDPANDSVQQRLDKPGLAAPTGGMVVGQTASEANGLVSELESGPAAIAEGGVELEPKRDKASFHLNSNAQQVIPEVFKAFGIQASVHDSVQARQVRLDLDEVNFEQAVKVLGLVTHTFYEALDPHRVIVAMDTRANRTQFQRLQTETIYLPGVTEKELTDVGNLARNVFGAQQSVAQPSKGTLTLRAPSRTLQAFNQTVSRLTDGKSQVDLEVRVIQLAYTSTRETGVNAFQQTQVANVYSEIQTILNQNQSAVQQIIASGVVPNANGLQNQLTIIGILLASGQATVSGVLSQGFALFGNGIFESAIAPGPATFNFNLNSSDTRSLDDVHLRLSDQETGTFKTGERYPIETSSYSSVAVSALSSAGQNQTIPQIQYEDLGLTVKATPSVMRSNEVALNLDLKIEALGGTSLNGIPVLASRQVSGVVTLKAGETAVLVSDLSRSEARALSGLPGLSDIPGLQDVNDITRSQNVARLLILVTPRVVRDVRHDDRDRMLMVGKSGNTP